MGVYALKAPLDNAHNLCSKEKTISACFEPMQSQSQYSLEMKDKPCPSMSIQYKVPIYHVFLKMIVR
jgi:hypothetical protein